MNFTAIKDSLRKNGPGYATVASIVLTGLSVIFAIRKSKEMAAVIDEYEEKKQDLDAVPIDCIKKGDYAVLAGEYILKGADAYKETLICAAGAMTCAYLSNRWNGRTIAGLSAALALSEDKIKKIYRKADEIYGKGGAPDLKEAVDCDNSDIPFDVEPEKARVRHRREETMWFKDSYTGTLFESNCRDVDNAIARAERIIEKDPRHSLNFNKWFSLLGLEDADCGIAVGWHRTHIPFKVTQKITEVNGRETIILTYDHRPEEKYDEWNRY